MEDSKSKTSSASSFALSSPSVPSSATPFANTRLAKWASGLSETAVDASSGAIAGAASGIVTCPLDVIKTKLQAQGGFRPKSAGPIGSTGSPSYRGMFGTARIIWNQDGIRGMYRGLSPMLLGYLPTWAVYMSVYGASKKFYREKIDSVTLTNLASSITAGACSTLTTNPIWVIKTRLMAQVGSAAAKESRTPWHYHGTFDAARSMYHNEGIGAFYSGLGPALLGLTHVAVQFPLYEFFKLQFTGVPMGQSAEGDTATQVVAVSAATFLSKVAATCATYPHEVLRTRLQTTVRRWEDTHPKPGAAPSTNRPRYAGVISTVKTILAEEGWRAFYYGMGTNLIRAVPAAVTTMVTYETVKGVIHKIQAEGREQAETS